MTRTWSLGFGVVAMGCSPIDVRFEAQINEIAVTSDASVNVDGAYAGSIGQVLSVPRDAYVTVGDLDDLSWDERPIVHAQERRWVSRPVQLDLEPTVPATTLPISLDRYIDTMLSCRTRVVLREDSGGEDVFTELVNTVGAVTFRTEGRRLQVSNLPAWVGGFDIDGAFVVVEGGNVGDDPELAGPPVDVISLEPDDIRLSYDERAGDDSRTVFYTCSFPEPS